MKIDQVMAKKSKRRPTDRPTDRQTDRQTDRPTDRPTDICITRAPMELKTIRGHCQEVVLCIEELNCTIAYLLYSDLKQNYQYLNEKQKYGLLKISI